MHEGGIEAARLPVNAVALERLLACLTLDLRLNLASCLSSRLAANSLSRRLRASAWPLQSPPQHLWRKRKRSPQPQLGNPGIGAPSAGAKRTSMNSIPHGTIFR